LAAPFRGGVAGVALVEPARRQGAEVFVQREMRELVMQHQKRVARVGTRALTLDYDAAGLGEGHRASPFGRAAGPLAKSPAVGSDRDDDTLLRPREAGKGVCRDGIVRE